MDEIQLRTFLAAAQYGSFSDAARALFVAQSSVTHRVRSLEREIGARLFHRQGRGVSLTEAGRAFIPYAQRCLAALEQGREALSGARPSGTRRVRILACPLAAAYELPGLLSAARLGDTPLEIQVAGSKRIFKRLLRGEADLGLTSIQFRHPAIETVRLAEHPLVLVRPTGVTGSRRRVLFHQEELEDLLLAQAVCRQVGWPVGGLFPVDDLLLLRRLLLAGFGAALAPEALVAEDLAAGRLEPVAPPATAPGPGGVPAAAHRAVTLLIPRHAAEGPLAAIVDRLRAHARG